MMYVTKSLATYLMINVPSLDLSQSHKFAHIPNTEDKKDSHCPKTE